MHWKKTNQLMIDRGDIPVGTIVSVGVRDPSVAAAYDAPFPDPKYKAGPLIMPQRVPVYLDDPAREANLKAWEVFQKWEKPFLTAFGDGDPITRGGDIPFQTRVPGAKGQAHTTVEGAGHFIQEMKGEELARIINQFIADAGSTRACDADPIILTTGDGIEFVRTPDSCFASLPDWPYEPKYVLIDGLRLAYVDEGPPDGEVVLLLHGQPSWSYLYRKMIPVLVEAGLRVIAMDHMGMGRSDKPIDIAYYSYLGHSDRLERFIQALGLTDITVFCQDWGSLIGLRIAGMHPDWFARIAVGDGTLPVLPAGVAPYPTVENPNEIDNELTPPFAPIPPQQPVFYDENCELVVPRGDYFFEWMTYAMKAGTFHASEVVEAMTWFDLPADEEAAYDAPFPSRIYMAGPRVFPSLVNDLPGVTEQAWKGLTSFAKPFVTIWASNDPGNLGQCSTQNNLICNIPGADGQSHTRLPEASHFLQDDQGPEIAARLVDFITNDAPTAAEYEPTCGIPIAADGTGTLRTEDADCSKLVANTCIKPAGSGNGFCSVQGCTAGSCADPYVCCHDCNPAAAPYLPFEGSACFPLDRMAPLITRVAYRHP
jgi:haloalkane dehalogenase